MDTGKQPDREAKRKLTEEPSADFDIIGVLLSNYGMTGENLVRQILSFPFCLQILEHIVIWISNSDVENCEKSRAVTW